MNTELSGKQFLDATAASIAAVLTNFLEMVVGPVVRQPVIANISWSDLVPLSYFIEKPFQNWTRVSADILGSVFVYTDYTLARDDIRKEVKRVFEVNPKWDGKFWNVH